MYSVGPSRRVGLCSPAFKWVTFQTMGGAPAPTNTEWRAVAPGPRCRRQLGLPVDHIDPLKQWDPTTLIVEGALMNNYMWVKAGSPETLTQSGTSHINTICPCTVLKIIIIIIRQLSNKTCSSKWQQVWASKQGLNSYKCDNYSQNKIKMHENSDRNKNNKNMKHEIRTKLSKMKLK